MPNKPKKEKGNTVEVIPIAVRVSAPFPSDRVRRLFFRPGSGRAVPVPVPSTFKKKQNTGVLFDWPTRRGPADGSERHFQLPFS